MYGKRIKIFIALSTAVLIVCVLRLVQMQLLPNSEVYDKIAELELQRGLSCRLNTIRGQILDRKGRILAADELCYQLNHKLPLLLLRRRTSYPGKDTASTAKISKARDRNNYEGRNK